MNSAKHFAEGVMSGIIDAKPFNDVFTATRNDSTMQGVVTAIYELGIHPFAEAEENFLTFQAALGAPSLSLLVETG